MRALSLSLLCLTSAPVFAEPPQVITIEAPTALHAGDRTNVSVDVTLPADAAEPVLLTTSSEGTALEVVRGRFARPDARDPKLGTLRFDVPVVARTPGAAIFRVHVLYYRCAQACAALEQDSQISIEIAPLR